MNKYGAFLFLLISLILPTYTGAQTASSTPSLYQDGSGESPTTRRERIGGYRRQSSETQQKINSLGSSAVQSLYMPVLFGVGINNISPNFGDPRSGGRTHAGEDIMAVKGTPIISPTQAVVLRTGVGETEGNYVYTANPGGEIFVYMHLDKIGEGVVSGLVLEQGSLIGYVGNTGNASGGAAHLHFEIHNSSNTPVDPFPRLTGELQPQDKMNYLAKIFAQTSDTTALAQFLVINFRSTFVTAQNTGITLHPLIVNALATISGSNSTSATSPKVILPADDLEVGSSGSAVVTLQTYLIQANVGPAARNLAAASATGNFGPITQAALIEFQQAKSISPANGYYGASTRVYITANPISLSQPVSAPIPTQPSSSTAGGLTLSRNLSQSMYGDDIMALQKTLNAQGFIVAQSGGGSPGNETNYFGPATAAAVIKFQIAKGITPAVGFVGPLTRAAISAL